MSGKYDDISCKRMEEHVAEKAVAELTQGSRAPSVSLPDQDGKKVTLKDLQGKWVVLYFYPKDNTPGCTMEAVYFSHYKKEFEEQNAVVLGVSPDSIESHCKFIDKHAVTITLLSDVDKTVLQKYGVWEKKKMYGKEYFGVRRSTFLIDDAGKIAWIWKKVKVENHIQEVLEKLKELRGQ